MCVLENMNSKIFELRRLAPVLPHLPTSTYFRTDAIIRESSISVSTKSMDFLFTNDLEADLTLVIF